MAKQEIALFDKLLSITSSIATIYQNLANYKENYANLVKDLKLAIHYEEKLINEIYYNMNIDEIINYLEDDSLQVIIGDFNPKARLFNKFSSLYYIKNTLNMNEDYLNKIDFIFEILKAKNHLALQMDHLKNNYYPHYYALTIHSLVYHYAYLESCLINNTFDTINPEWDLKNLIFMYNTNLEETRIITKNKAMINIFENYNKMQKLYPEDISDLELTNLIDEFESSCYFLKPEELDEIYKFLSFKEPNSFDQQLLTKISFIKETMNLPKTIRHYDKVKKLAIDIEKGKF